MEATITALGTVVPFAVVVVVNRDEKPTVSMMR